METIELSIDNRTSDWIKYSTVAYGRPARDVELEVHAKLASKGHVLNALKELLSILRYTE